MDKNRKEHSRNMGNARDRKEDTASLRNTVDTPEDRDAGDQSKNPGQGDTRTPKTKTHAV
jgi:hypothetical protein